MEPWLKRSICYRKGQRCSHPGSTFLCDLPFPL